MATTRVSPHKNPLIFSPEEIRNIADLGDILRQIRSRLKSEGISIAEARNELLKTDQNYLRYATQEPR